MLDPFFYLQYDDNLEEAKGRTPIRILEETTIRMWIRLQVINPEPENYFESLGNNY